MADRAIKVVRELGSDRREVRSVPICRGRRNLAEKFPWYERTARH